MSRRFLFMLPILIAIAFVPVARAQVLPATPDPVSCSLTPLTPDELLTITAVTAEEPAPLMATRMTVPQETVDAVTEVVLASLACTNANQPLSALAVYSDRWLQERFSGDAGRDELGHLIAASSRTPMEAAVQDRIALISVENPMAYNGARIGITVTTANADETYIDELIFVQVNSDWKIDQTIARPDSNATPQA